MRPTPSFIVTCLCLLLAGCGVTQPSRYYLLTPVEGGGSGETATPGPALGVGPVDFPAYLDRPGIVHRSGENQLQFAAFHRWAEPLKTTFNRTLEENLSVLLPGDRIIQYPWTRSTRIDYQVTVEVMRFDADADGTVVLDAGWEVIRAKDGTLLARRKETYSEAAGGLDYPAIVAAQSRAVARLSRDIAGTIEHH